VPCPTCSTQSPEVALYCYRCGTSLRGSASTRAGSYAADLSPRWAKTFFAGGWQPPLYLAAGIMAAEDYGIMSM